MLGPASASGCDMIKLRLRLSLGLGVSKACHRLGLGLSQA